MDPVNETEYTNEIAPPYTRIRTYFATDRGQVIRFVVKLEYNISNNTALLEKWEEVARFDHNPESQDGHDITDEGLHMDLIEPNGDDRRAWGFPDVPINDAPRWCESYFESNHRRLTKRFAKEIGIEKWNLPTRR
ncbi:DUF7718 family protein [Natronorubrum daqingense]|uniref:DUF7718 domain-containing protein n=1 Tax=Natronorubrum daqingense TaxID=588898 RepID=A0A1N7FY48_9EURY|nr:hypothetical protein BB347_17780 [Natronorubrum daqingense]SIS05241.1 hypothetical protein SAMN05421809_3562 [Natronorubrum daqingense]